MKNCIYLVILLATLSGCASQKGNDQFSGFLTERYYDKLSKIKSPSDEIIFRYISPDFEPTKYKHAIVEPITAYPKPKPTEKVSKETLLTLQSKLTTLIENSLPDSLSLVKDAGPDVLRIQIVITAVNIADKKLAAYEYIPTALVLAEASKAAGFRDQSVKLFLEGKVTDTATNEVLAVGVREIKGEDLENAKSKLQANELNKGLTKAGKEFLSVFNKTVSK